MNWKLMRRKSLNIKVRQSVERRPDKTSWEGEDRLHLGVPSANVEFKALLGEEEGLRYELTDCDGRAVTIYRRGTGFSAFS